MSTFKEIEDWLWKNETESSMWTNERVRDVAKIIDALRPKQPDDAREGMSSTHVQLEKIVGHELPTGAELAKRFASDDAGCGGADDIAD
jgi:hypothetical protein